MTFNTGAGLGQARGEIIVDVSNVREAALKVARYARQMQDALSGIGGGSGGGSSAGRAASRMADGIAEAFTRAQRSIQKAQAEINAQVNRFQTARIGANIDTGELESFQRRFSGLRQPIQDARELLARMRSDAADLGDAALLESFKDDLVQIARLTGRATSEVGELTGAVTTFEQRAAASTRGVRGYFAQLRGELERINEQGLGRNFQELGFSLAPISLAAGAGLAQGVERALDLEEITISFEAITSSQQESVELMRSLTSEAQRFGLPILGTLNAFQRLAPVVEQSGGDIRDFVSIAARLATINPTQGVEGAVIAISEALSGSGNDFVSLTERFNISRAALRSAVQETGSIQAGIERVLDTYGRTEEVAERFGRTGRTAFRQFGEALANFLATAVAPFLQALTPILNKATELFNSLAGGNPVLAQLTGGFLILAAALSPLLILVGNLVIAFESLKAAQLGVVAGGAIRAATGVLAGSAIGQTANVAVTGGVAAGGGAAVGGAIAAVVAPALALAAAFIALDAALKQYNAQLEATRAFAQQALEAEQRRIQERAPELPEVSAVANPEELANAARERAAFFEQEANRVEQQRLQFQSEVDATFGGLGLLTGEFRAANDQLIATRDELRRLSDEALAASLNAEEAVAAFQAEAEATRQRTIATNLLRRAVEEATPFVELFGNVIERLQPPTAFERLQEGLGIVGDKADSAASSLWGFVSGLVRSGTDGARSIGEIASAVSAFAQETASINFDRALQSFRDLEDIAIQRRRDIDNFNRSLEDFDAQTAAQASQALSKLNSDIARLETQAVSRREEMTRTYQEQEQRSLEDHLARMAEIRSSADLDIADAAARLDGAAVFEAQQRRDKALSDEEADYNRQAQRRREDFNQQIVELNTNLQAQRAERLAAYQQQTTEQAAQRQQERLRLIEDFQRRIQLEDEDRVRRLQRQAEDNARADALRQQDFQRRYSLLIRDSALNNSFVKGLVSTAASTRNVFSGLMSYVAQQVNVVASAAQATVSGGAGGGRGVATPTAYATGASRVSGGLALLHAGEGVMNPTTAAIARSMLGENYTQPQLANALRGGGSTANVSVVVNGAGGDANQVAEAVRREVVTALKQVFNT